MMLWSICTHLPIFSHVVFKNIPLRVQSFSHHWIFFQRAFHNKQNAIQQSPLFVVCFPWFQLLLVNHGEKIFNFPNHWHHLLLASNHRHCHGYTIQDHLKRMVIFVVTVTYCQKVHSCLTLCHNAYVIHLTSPHRIGILSSQVIKRRASTIK